LINKALYKNKLEKRNQMINKRPSFNASLGTEPLDSFDEDPDERQEEE
jgi:hypothetical protein